MTRPPTTSFLDTFATPLPEQEVTDGTCLTHGPFEARIVHRGLGERLVTSPCPACVSERKAVEQARKQRETLAEQERRVAALMSASGIPKRFASQDFARFVATTPNQKKVVRMCKAFADEWQDRMEEGGSLLMTGASGTGKTSLACAIGNHVMRAHSSTVLFGTVSTMLRRIKDTYRRDSRRSEQDAIDDLVRPDLLILDEVGVQVGSDHEKLLMFEVLNARYQDCRPTILISNLSGDELKGVLGLPLMDRYRECGAILAFDWESHRGRQH